LQGTSSEISLLFFRNRHLVPHVDLSCARMADDAPGKAPTRTRYVV
jgi:hypothetical protein